MTSTGTFNFVTPIMNVHDKRTFELTTSFGKWILRVSSTNEESSWHKVSVTLNTEKPMVKRDPELNVQVKYYGGPNVERNIIENLILKDANKIKMKDYYAQSFITEYTYEYHVYFSVRKESYTNYDFKLVVVMEQISKDPAFIEPPTAPPNSLASYFLRVFETEKIADILLKTSDGKTIKANRAVLSRSPVFDAMFNHDTQEAQQRVVQITDMTHDALKELVRYIYTDEVPKLKEYAVDLLIAANKYDFPGLFEICERYLKLNPTVGNLTRAVEFAELLELEDVVNSLIKFIINNKDVVFESDEWKSMEKNNPALGMRIMKACMKFKD